VLIRGYRVASGIEQGALRASAMLSVSQLSKSFAGRVLFDDVSLQVNHGDRIGFQT
jgi:ABC-type transporter Mla maintaining outer membrane lipid asymmetry ATPase subunit MlaF